MKKIYLLLFVAVSLFITANAQINGEKAIFVIASVPGNDAELAIMQRLVEMGLDTTVLIQTVVSDADMDGADILLISATVNSGTAFESMPGLASYEIPVINWEPGLYDELGFSVEGGGSVVEPEGNIKIVDDEHPLAAELTGTVNIATVTGEFKVTTGKPEGDVNIIAVSTTDDSLAVLFAYEAGAAMATGNAPARRVGTFLHNEVAKSMNDNGWALFDISIEWALGVIPDFVINNKAQTIEMSVYPNPTSGIFELSFVSDYPQMVEINISNVMGQNVLSTTFQANNGMNNLKLDASELNNGLYYYSVSINNRIASGKILIIE